MASKATRRAVEEEDLANVEFETSEDVEVVKHLGLILLKEFWTPPPLLCKNVHFFQFQLILKHFFFQFFCVIRLG